MKKIAIKYGLWMLVGFTAFFLLMHLLGLSQNIYLRVLNGIVHMSIIYLAIKAYRDLPEGSVSNYISGVAMGMYASAIGVVGFCIFMFFFLWASPEFLAEIKGRTPIGDYLNPLTATFFILVEGIAISLIGSYIITRIVNARFVEN